MIDTWISDAGSTRSRGPNHLNTACWVTAVPGPVPAPSSRRLATSAAKPLLKLTSSCASIHTSDMPKRIQRVGKRLARKPTSTPETE